MGDQGWGAGLCSVGRWYFGRQLTKKGWELDTLANSEWASHLRDYAPYKCRDLTDGLREQACFEPCGLWEWGECIRECNTRFCLSNMG